MISTSMIAPPVVPQVHRPCEPLIHRAHAPHVARHRRLSRVERLRRKVAQQVIAGVFAAMLLVAPYIAQSAVTR